MTKIEQFILLLLFSLPTLVHGQDIHFSQYSFAPSLLSPALSNSFPSEFRGGALYRNQWASVPVNYSSFFGYFDKKVLRKVMGNAVAFGASFQYDKAGDAGLGLMQIKMNETVSRKLSKNLVLSIGIGIGYANRQYNPEKLTFGSQFADSFQPNKPNDELFDKTSIGFWNLSAGINGRYQLQKRLKMDFGASLEHLNSPKINFQNEDLNLVPSPTLYMTGAGALADKTDLLLNLIYRHQLSYNEIVMSTGLKYYLNRETNKDLAVSFLIGLRQKDAFFPEFHVYYKNWTGGFSYDKNTSDFSIATAGKGGPELSLTYQANVVVPPKKSKLCPVF